MSSVYDDVMNIFNGQTPIKRQNPRPGESQYYYVNSGQGNFTAFSDVKTTDIPDEKPLFNTGQSLQQMQTQMHPDYSQPASLEFNGTSLVWLQNGEPVKYYQPAMSGKPEHQTRMDTHLVNVGPIPEGDWILKRNTGEHHNPGEWRTFDEVISNTGQWKKFPNSWGNSRIPIQPMEGTNTYGRDNMYIHGGAELGSAGCIDLTERMSDFYNDFKNYDGDIPLKVKYPKNW